jgi:hypothetical protein
VLATGEPWRVTLVSLLLVALVAMGLWGLLWVKNGTVALIDAAARLAKASECLIHPCQPKAPPVRPTPDKPQVAKAEPKDSPPTVTQVSTAPQAPNVNGDDNTITYSN